MLAPKRPLGVSAYVWNQLNQNDRTALVRAIDAAERVNDLTLAAARLAEGKPVDLAWIRVQLLDLRDFLEVSNGD